MEVSLGICSDPGDGIRNYSRKISYRGAGRELFVASVDIENLDTQTRVPAFITSQLNHQFAFHKATLTFAQYHCLASYSTL